MYMHVCTVLFIHFSLILYKVAIVNFYNKRFIIIINWMQRLKGRLKKDCCQMNWRKFWDCMPETQISWKRWRKPDNLPDKFHISNPQKALAWTQNDV